MEKLSFFVTCGRGMDYFVLKELNNKRHVIDIDGCDGKVFFDFLYRVEQVDFKNLECLLQIKSAERLFVNVCKMKSSRRASTCLLKDCQAWKKSLDIWALFHSQELNATHSSEEFSYAIDHSPPLKKWKHDKFNGKVTFRVSCKCTGKQSRKMYSEVNRGCF